MLLANSVKDICGLLTELFTYLITVFSDDEGKHICDIRRFDKEYGGKLCHKHSDIKKGTYTVFRNKW
jgi:hypothetical protein